MAGIRKALTAFVAAAVMVLVLLPVAAGAQEVLPDNTVTVAGAQAPQSAGDPGVQVAGAEASRSSLAFTGSDIAGLVAISVGLIVTGLVVLSISRRRSSSS